MFPFELKETHQLIALFFAKVTITTTVKNTFGSSLLYAFVIGSLKNYKMALFTDSRSDVLS